MHDAHVDAQQLESEREHDDEGIKTEHEDERISSNKLEVSSTLPEVSAFQVSESTIDDAADELAVSLGVSEAEAESSESSVLMVSPVDDTSSKQSLDNESTTN